MVKVEDSVTARYEKDGLKFEILVDPRLAMELKKGNEINFNEMLVIDSIFKDASKGDVASDENVKKVFETTDVEAVAKKIIQEGELQLTTEQRKEMREVKRKEIIQFIVTNAFNPQTNTPHPPQRIENALEEAKIHIDPMKTPQEQLPKIIDEIKKLIPISFEKQKVALKIPARFAGKASNILHKYSVKKEEWKSDGSLLAMVELPSGLKNDLLNELNTLTHGDMETKLLKEHEKF
ncbi:MAG: ribosome assembly factor SBDS [Candidatus Diapherotrites archaeon]